MEKYEKIRIVGRGAYGTVYLCKRITDDKLVIIKQIPVEQMTKDERQAALNEVKVLSMLDHPNIIEYYENFLEDKALMIVMEYAEGGTLYDFLQERNGNLLEEQEILNYLAQMVLSLQHVHSKQILHRDLKTQNILLDKRKEIVKIGDFGISKVLSSKSKAFTVVGTPCYISPELCEGKAYDQKSDIWALGCVLYELASLKRAFEAANLPALVLKIMRGTFSPVSDVYSEELRQLILSLLHLDPKKRPHINQLMAEPIVVNPIMELYTDMGKVPASRVHKTFSPAHRAKNPAVRSGSRASEEGKPGLEQSTYSCVYGWGNGIQQPTKLPLPAVDTDIVQVAAGRSQRAAVTKNGRLIVWESSSIDGEVVMVPRYLEGQSGVTIQHVSCGDLFTACLTDRGILMTFGSGANGSLGHDNYHDVTQAKIVEALLGYEIVQVSCGGSHVLAVTNDHEVFAWGRGQKGRLGLADQDTRCSPTAVTLPEHHQAHVVLCGVDCSLLMTTQYNVLCTGSNRYNKLCLDGAVRVDEVHAFTLIESEPLCNVRVRRAAFGTSHTAFLTENGYCFTAGSNQFGQLGHDAPERQCGLVHELNNLSNLDCGDTYTVTVAKDGSVYSWGKDARGRLGRTGASHLPGLVALPEAHKHTIQALSCCHGTTMVATKLLEAANRRNPRAS